ncbi:ABC transporter permease [Nocardioides speluncae]|uniref:ABC transporter permease n=1 Tax=Nocardioides speluncae TaxID=2670337 RepID=UPI000D69AD73|nr:FtsX-like permease family protein [Nocardioides speluncae]
MWKVTWRNLWARKIRLFLSGLAVVLGVAFVAGTFIFTDAMSGSFDKIIEGSTADVEVAFEGANDFDSSQDSRLLPASVVGELRALPGAESVHPNNTLTTVFAIDPDGKVIGGNGPPGLAFGPTDAESITGIKIMAVTDGEYPDAPYEVALDEKTADKAEVEIGDKLEIVTPAEDPVMEVTLTGLVEFGGGTGLNGATLTVFDQKFLQDQFFDGQDGYMSVALNAKDGVTQAELRDQAQAVLPAGATAEAGDDYVEEQKNGLEQIFSFLEYFLLAFAAISLIVGIFMIINTFSILVAQRSRELALLRAMGASRRQVMGSVIVEALAVGIVGSLIGLGAGYLLARGLAVVFGAIGLDLAGASFVLDAEAVAWSLSVGILVTLVAAVVPAMRASRIPPIQALRDDVALPETALHRRVIVAGLLAVLGIAAIVLGFLADSAQALAVVGLGMLSILVAAAMVSPILARPVIWLFGTVYRSLYGMVGRLATQNSMRNPRRTAATASALMIGLAVVGLLSVVASSTTASTEEAVEEQVTSQFIIRNVAGQSPFSTGYAEKAREVPGVAAVAPFRSVFNAKLEGRSAFLGATDPAALAEAMRLPMVAGGLAALGPGQILVGEERAESQNLKVGDKVTLELQGGKQELEVAGMLGIGSALPADVLVTLDTLEKGGPAPLDSLVFITADPGADLDQVFSDLEGIVEENPTVTVSDPEALVDAQKDQINQILYLMYGLLGLAIVIAVLGIISTLWLSVIERTREVGLLRAVGLSRSQLRRMIRLEAVVVAVFGAMLGLLLGIAFGAGLIYALRDQGLTVFAVPWGRLLIFVVLAGLVGVLASLFPAHRAARLDVLKAIATE